LSITTTIKGILQRRRYLLNRRVGSERVGGAAFYGWVLRGRATRSFRKFHGVALQ